MTPDQEGRLVRNSQKPFLTDRRTIELFIGAGLTLPVLCLLLNELLSRYEIETFAVKPLHFVLLSRDPGVGIELFGNVMNWHEVGACAFQPGLKEFGTIRPDIIKKMDLPFLPFNPNKPPQITLSHQHYIKCIPRSGK